MAVIDKLVISSLSRNEEANTALAEHLAETADAKSVQQLVAHLSHSDKSIHSDCIKVLYEVGKRDASLIAPHLKDFSALLSHTSNRMVWGAMYALDAIASVSPAEVYRELSRIMEAVDHGSVITRDRAVSILTKLAAVPKYADEAFPLLFEQLKSCPANQLPMYAEYALPVINSNNKSEFISIVRMRLGDMPTENKRKRLEKVIRKIT